MLRLSYSELCLCQHETQTWYLSACPQNFLSWMKLHGADLLGTSYRVNADLKYSIKQLKSSLCGCRTAWPQCTDVNSLLVETVGQAEPIVVVVAGGVSTTVSTAGRSAVRVTRTAHLRIIIDIIIIIIILSISTSIRLLFIYLLNTHSA